MKKSVLRHEELRLGLLKSIRVDNVFARYFLIVYSVSISRKPIQVYFSSYLLQNNVIEIKL